MSLMDDWLENAKKQASAKASAERAARPKGQKCSNCQFHRGHEFSPKYHYCRLGTSPHTSNGFAKTPAGGWCEKWQTPVQVTPEH